MAVVELFLVVLVPFLGLLSPSVAYRMGAPGDTVTGICSTLMPDHGMASSQTSASPYTISFTPQNFTAGGAPVTVTLSTASGAAFKGFLLTTQYVDPAVDQNLRPGTFSSIPANTKLTCSNTAVTHSQINTQNSLTFTWTPPQTSQGDIRFRVTFVRTMDTLWADRRSDTLQSVDGADSGNSTITQPPPPATQPPVATNAPVSAGRVTKESGCGDTKGCYSDCQGNDCSFLVTWAPGPSDDRVTITMSASMDTANGRYMALGLSEDDKMGSDSVTYCINAKNGVYNAYNVAGSKFCQLLNNPQAGLDSMASTFADGVFTCRFTRVKAADSTGQRAALNKPYTLFFAVGPGSAAGAGKHDKVPLVSTQAVSLTDFKDIGGSSDFPLVKAHGSLMIAAWIFAASIGIVMARYFKNISENDTCCGQKIWFQAHRTFMILAFLATAAAFVIIFISVGGFMDTDGGDYKQKAHPIMGIIVMAFTVINPIMAVFRPHPGTPKRPIFNWAHWFVGTSAHILGVITVFFGVLLPKSGAPDYMIYILAAYAGWQVLVQLLLELTHCVGQNSSNSGSLEMTDINGDPPSSPTAKKETNLNKNMLLFLHVMVVAGFTSALIILLNMDNDNK